MLRNKVAISNRKDIVSTIGYVLVLIMVLGLVWIFMKDDTYNSYTIGLSLLIIIISCVLFIIYAHVKIGFHQFAFLCLLFCGSISVFIQPIFNIPDEPTHYTRAELISRGEFFVDPAETSHTTIQAVFDLQKDMEKTYVDSQIQGEKINQSAASIEHVAGANLPIIYIPQTIGILIAKLLNLDLIWSLWLARLFNLICYALLIMVSLKLAGSLQAVLFFVAALPMSIQQAASCSPDAIINGSVFLLIGYFICLYKKNKINLKDVIIFFVLSLLVLTSKVTNIFFCGLFLLLPLEKHKKARNAVLIKMVFLLIVILCGGVYYIYTSQFPVPDVHKVYLESIGADSGEQIKYILTNTVQWISDFGTSLVENCFSYTAMLNEFGWLKYSYSILTVIMLFMFGKLCAQEKDMNISLVGKVLILLMVVGNYSFSCLALYISWTPVGSAEINGIQGRYFIPLIAALALLLTSNKNKTQNIILQKNDMIVILTMIGMMLIKTVTYYYS